MSASATKRMTLGRGLSVLGAVSLMAAVAPPGLQALRDRLGRVVCANNLQTCHQAWNVYARQFDGVWMAPWDQANMLADDSYPYDQQWPYTMTVYVMGYALPDGEDVYEPTLGGWWSPDGRGSHDRKVAPPLKCPALSVRPVTNPWWKPWTSYSYAIMGGHVEAEGGVDYAIDDYPLPDAMTHPATTVLLHDAVLPYPESSDWSAWSSFHGSYPGSTGLIPTDPHDGKSNYLMCDGHVDLLAVEDLDETMWMSRWVPEAP
ncbi:MAG: H-X9-DG-CTERM domain-containing protein [Planctomycetota bacterium]